MSSSTTKVRHPPVPPPRPFLPPTFAPRCYSGRLEILSPGSSTNTVKTSGDLVKAHLISPIARPDSVSLRSFSPRQNSRPRAQGHPGLRNMRIKPSPAQPTIIRSSNFLRVFVRSGLPQSPWSGERSRRSKHDGIGAHMI